ncbi:SRPBCC family protein [Arthrobacter sp. 35W]|uniref:SRPBCC family protein n=1 Tax=Arthrobacter sp. 35W TaxID=1132441 RepID=UPI00041EA90C|nr:SRPBCC family protein [Arthrobacter sp. 35W]
MESFAAEALINADCSTVWDIITDEGNYTLWPSGIVWIEGEIGHGSTIRIRTANGGRRTLRVHVHQIPGQEMIWTGGMPLGLFTGVRTFTITAQDRMTHLHVREDFSGLLLPLVRKTTSGQGHFCTEYVNAVKARAEMFPWPLPEHGP